MNLYKSLAGLIQVEMVSAALTDCLTAVNNHGIPMSDVIWKNDLTAEAVIKRKDYNRLKSILDHRGDTVKIINKAGLYWAFRSLKTRPILLGGVVLILLLAMFIPRRIYFVKVEGNSLVKEQQILDIAEDSGVYTGASRRKIRSEQVKNGLLAAIPQLKWAGVNTYGCVAVITVEERSKQIQETKELVGSSIIARCDGVIQSITVTQGNALCKEGQAVNKGQILVSGYTDCGIVIQATGAKAEIYAQTNRTLQGLIPANRNMRTGQKEQTHKYYLIFGKNIIKLCKDSGISDTGYAKIYEENFLTLPGGFQLPIGLGCETLINYNCQDKEAVNTLACSWLEEQCDSYISQHMIGGQILDKQYSVAALGDVLYFKCDYTCSENIGEIYNGEIYNKNG